MPGTNPTKREPDDRDPADNVLRRMQLDWTPERAATVGLALGALAAALWAALILLDRYGHLDFTLQAGHNVAVGGLAATLAGLTLRNPRTAAAGYAAWTGAYALLLPVLLSGIDPRVGAAEGIAYGAVLVQIAAIWGFVTLLLFLFKSWMLRWAEKRLAFQARP